jgi:hypothetical protein
MSLKRFFTLISLSIVFCAVFLVGNQALVLAQSSGSVDEAFFADMQFLSDNTKACFLSPSLQILTLPDTTSVTPVFPKSVLGQVALRETVATWE